MVIKSRKRRWERHAVSKGQMRNSLNMFNSIPEGMRLCRHVIDNGRSEQRDKNFPPIQWVLSLGIMRLEHDVDHSTPPIAMIKNEHSHTSTSLYAFMLSTGTILPSCLTSPFLQNSTTDLFSVLICCCISRYYTSHTCAVPCVPKLCSTLCTVTDNTLPINSNELLIISHRGNVCCIQKPN
jgi:hypothetical protein